MSIDMTPRAIEYKVKAGSRATLQLTISDSSGSAKSLSNTTTYATGKWKVWKPDGTLQIDGSVTFSDRANGVVSYALSATDATNAKAGRWEGEVELLDSNGVISEQTESFSFTISESY
tara:strand:- start:6824 stop:7177 length:354 start_codon:yes stop_codon:yes gene_type:complete